MLQRKTTRRAHVVKLRRRQMMAFDSRFMKIVGRMKKSMSIFVAERNQTETLTAPPAG
jgi:hypothetical protein